jgi:ABC-2 type transport system ATP-binding protein
MTDLLNVHNVSKQFASQRALDDVSIGVPKGSIYGLLGPNGAGKTTLIRIINQITGPDEGSILLNGKSLNRSMIGRIGYLPEERGLYKKMQVGEQSMYLAQLKGLSKNEARSRLKDWFERFEISNWWNKKVEELSKGMQQKIQFIVTVLHEPDLLIFDEPFSGFDPINITIIKQEILRLKEKGATIIFSTHNMASVEELCDHIGLIHRGRKILEGEIGTIKQSYRTNTFEIHVESGSADLKDSINDHFNVLENAHSGNTHTLRVRLSDKEEKNALLQQLITSVNVVSFREIFPDINDIFIHKVKETDLTSDQTK